MSARTFIDGGPICAIINEYAISIELGYYAQSLDDLDRL